MGRSDHERCGAPLEVKPERANVSCVNSFGRLLGLPGEDETEQLDSSLGFSLITRSSAQRTHKNCFLSQSGCFPKNKMEGLQGELEQREEDV